MRTLYTKCIFLLLLAAYTFGSLSAQTMTAQEERKVAAQKAADDKTLQEYFAKNNIHPQKNAVGVYYTVAKEGTGNKILAGETVSLNYTGKLLDGTVFDSNTDPAFHHTEPLVFEVGKGSVIRGYDKGVQMLRKGSVATLYIPSTLAYRDEARNLIPANSILVFDVEVLDVTK